MKVGITSKDKSVMDLSMLAYGKSGSGSLAFRRRERRDRGEQLKMLQVYVDRSGWWPRTSRSTNFRKQFRCP